MSDGTSCPGERADLGAMLAAVRDRKVRTFDYMRELSRMGPEQLRQSGHRDVGSALLHAIQHGMAEVGKLDRAFLRRWPDR